MELYICVYRGVENCLTDCLTLIPIDCKLLYCIPVHIPSPGPAYTVSLPA